MAVRNSREYIKMTENELKRTEVVYDENNKVIALMYEGIILHSFPLVGFLSEIVTINGTRYTLTVEGQSNSPITRESTLESAQGLKYSISTSDSFFSLKLQ